MADVQINTVKTFPYEFTEIFRIGDEARGDTILFTAHRASVIAVNSTRQLFVGDLRSPVMSFSDEGHFIGFIGASGEGPGEFKRISNVVIGPGDSIYVHDLTLDRLLVYEPNMLDYAFSLPNIRSSRRGFFDLLGVTPKSFLFQSSFIYCPPEDPVCGHDPDETKLDSVFLVDKRGVMAETSIAKLPAEEVFVKASTGFIAVIELPFGKEPFFAHKNGLLYAGWNDAIDISVVSEDGDVLRTIKGEHTTMSITREEIDSELSNLPEEYRNAILSSRLLPETKPAYDELVVDDQGQVWIREYPDTDSEFAKWLIIDSDSKLVGEMELPTNLLLKTIKGDRAYASINSEMYGPYIVVYEITE